MEIQQCMRAFACSTEVFGTIERERRLDERGDRQPVPRRHHFVVARGLGPLPPRRAQRRTHPLVSVGVIGRGPQLQHRRTVFERSVRRDTENCCRPMAVALTENFGQLVRRPHIRQTLDTGSVCIQRGDEHRVAPQVVQQEPRRLIGDSVRQLISGASR